jgi:hypothetical protein
VASHSEGVTVVWFVIVFIDCADFSLFCSFFEASRSSPFNETTNEPSRRGHGEDKF